MNPKNMEPALIHENTYGIERVKVLDSRAPQSRSSSKQFAGIVLVEREDRVQQSREMGEL